MWDGDTEEFLLFTFNRPSFRRGQFKIIHPLALCMYPNEERETATSSQVLKHVRLPSVISRGHDAVERIAESIALLGKFHNALLICDDITYGIAGRQIESLLGDAGFNVAVYRIPDATYEVLEKAKGIIREKGIDIALGVGGGRPIDIAKKSSFDMGIPFVSVPTAPSHDGIGSARASIRNECVNVSMAAHPPSVIVADTGILSAAPYRLIASGCGDVISNITAVRDWELGRDEKGEEFSEYAAELSLLSARLLIRHAEMIPARTEESVKIVINALITSGIAMAVAYSSRPASGAEHKFSHTLDKIAERPALHGEQCALGTIVVSYLQGGDWQEIKRVMETIGLPTTAKGLGLKQEEIKRALVEAKNIRPERYTIFRDGLSYEEAEKALRHVGIID